MPIGLVSDIDLQRELESLAGSTSRSRVDSTPKSKIEVIPSRGRKDGDVGVPESLRKIIGESSVIDGRQAGLQIAKDFGISSSSVSAYAAGATSTASYKTPNQEIISHINRSRQRAIKKAGRTLNSALEAITQEKLDYTDAKDLSIIAKNMSAVIKDLEPTAPTESTTATQAPQFVVFAPVFRDERSFESIIVNE
jgi:hypothetical protein